MRSYSVPKALTATVCGLGIAGAAVAGAGFAGADPGPGGPPDEGGRRIVINGHERTDVERVILRADIDRELPGYRLPDGSPGVIILKNGETQPIPEGAVLHRQERREHTTGR